MTDGSVTLSKSASFFELSGLETLSTVHRRIPGELPEAQILFWNIAKYFAFDLMQ